MDKFQLVLKNVHMYVLYYMHSSHVRRKRPFELLMLFQRARRKGVIKIKSILNSVSVNTKKDGTSSHIASSSLYREASHDIYLRIFTKKMF